MALRVGAGQSAQNEYQRRLRSWRTASRRRFLYGLPVAAAVAGLLDWWIGWRITGVPLFGHGAALAVLAAWCGTLAAPQHVTAWRSGAEGERKTARALAPLARQGAVILHDRAIPGRKANIDHLAVGSWGIALVDTKNWQAKGAKVAVSRDGATLWYGAYAQNRTVATVQGEARSAAAVLRRREGLPVDIQSIIAVQGASVGRRGILVFDGVVVLEAHRLRKYLRRQRVILSPAEVIQIGRAADQALPPKS
ncbi:nuclease-related domain-containing protein [Streptomyces subrutilus]|uniref:NERD domain-containing protein n=1 Tax=Streptomyces subrutilus TaxID=36818 RepID=A0A1E5NXC2_9ACTN|nr:nuclease-related domain-containing protein [Streptomyces subrutilus]OEJ20875.1 hypothetical protein BGK67_35145 [Streptomyces subrutilus]